MTAYAMIRKTGEQLAIKAGLPRRSELGSVQTEHESIILDEHIQE
jgi:hypothetical protein